MNPTKERRRKEKPFHHTQIQSSAPLQTYSKVGYKGGTNYHVAQLVRLVSMAIPKAGNSPGNSIGFLEAIGKTCWGTAQSVCYWGPVAAILSHLRQFHPGEVNADIKHTIVHKAFKNQIYNWNELHVWYTIVYRTLSEWTALTDGQKNTLLLFVILNCSLGFTNEVIGRCNTTRQQEFKATLGIHSAAPEGSRICCLNFDQLSSQDS